MPELDVEIGGRVFQVTCQAGEEHFLQHASRMLDTEARTLADKIGRIPEARMLLMAGLMLADKTVGLEEELRTARQRLEAQSGELAGLKAAPPTKVEVPVIPSSVTDSLAELAARAESLAESLDERVASKAG